MHKKKKMLGRLNRLSEEFTVTKKEIHKKQPIMRQVRQGKLIDSEDLLSEVLLKGFKPHEGMEVRSVFFMEGAHDYKLSYLDVANRLGIARETAAKYVIPQLDVVKTDWHLRKMYNSKNCRLQYLVSVSSLNEYLAEVFQIERKAISIVYDLETDFTEEEMNIIRRLGHKRGWQKKFTEACIKYNIEAKNDGLFNWDNSLEIKIEEIGTELDKSKLWSMRDILSDNDTFANFKYSEQVYRFLDRTNYIQGKLPITENDSNSQGIRYIFDSNLETRVNLDCTKYLYFSISESTYNLLRALLFMDKGLKYSFRDEYSTDDIKEIKEAEKEFKKLLFLQVVPYL